MTNQCPDCRVKMYDGFILVPVLGRIDGFAARDGDTLNACSGAFTSCLKCRKCGHSEVTVTPINSANPVNPGVLRVNGKVVRMDFQ